MKTTTRGILLLIGFLIAMAEPTTDDPTLWAILSITFKVIGLGIVLFAAKYKL